MTHYVKIYSGITESSVCDLDVPTRWLWVVMLTKADRYGNVYGTPTALARIANLTLEQTLAGLDHLTSPDHASTSKEEEGRRVIECSQNLWHIVNYLKYRDLRDPEHQREQVKERVRRYRDKQKDVTPVTHVTQNVTLGNPIAESREAESKEERKEVCGDGSPHSRRKSPGPKKQTNPNIRRVIDCYVAGYRHSNPDHPNVSIGGREGKLIGGLLGGPLDPKMVALVAYWWGRAPSKTIPEQFRTLMYLPNHYDLMLRELRAEGVSLDLDSPALPIARFFSDPPAGQAPTGSVADLSGDSR